MHVNVSGRSVLLFNNLIDWLIDWLIKQLHHQQVSKFFRIRSIARQNVVLVYATARCSPVVFYCVQEPSVEHDVISNSRCSHADVAGVQNWLLNSDCKLFTKIRLQYRLIYMDTHDWTQAKGNLIDNDQYASPCGLLHYLCWMLTWTTQKFQGQGQGHGFKTNVCRVVGLPRGNTKVILLLWMILPASRGSGVRGEHRTIHETFCRT